MISPLEHVYPTGPYSERVDEEAERVAQTIREFQRRTVLKPGENHLSLIIVIRHHVNIDLLIRNGFQVYNGTREHEERLVRWTYMH